MERKPIRKADQLLRLEQVRLWKIRRKYPTPLNIRLMDEIITTNLPKDGTNC